VSVDVKISLDGRSMVFMERIGDASKGVQRQLLRTIDMQNQLTIGFIQKEKLSKRGPDTLGVVTNRLRSSIRATKAELRSDGGIYSMIGSNVVYAGIHEFGFQGDVKVRAHTRRVDQFISEANSTAVFDPASGKISKRKRKPKTTTVEIQVRAHSRKVNMPARHYIRRSIEQRVKDYTVAIGATIDRILNP